tara:strand:+ start:226 stop:1215 length:990 start_codon:yes stop_codon:yes gene_type:complete
MKNLITLIIFALTSTVLNAQVTDAEKALRKTKEDTTQGWKTGGTFGVNFTQVSLSNWAAGGQSSVSLNSLLDLFANYKKGTSAWDNNLTLGYGETQIGGSEWIKSDDRILLNSKYGKKASKHWYYAGLLNFKSQFAPGFSDESETTKISDFMAPGYLLGALGMDFKPSENLTLFISPFTSKLTVVNIQSLADVGAFGVEAAEFDALGNKTKDGNTSRMEIGGYLRLLYKREIAENVTYQTNLDLFSNYTNNPQNIDVNWDNLIGMKINKYLTTTISTSLIYDDDIDIAETKSDGTPRIDNNGNQKIGPRTQFKYVLAVGFQYKFGDGAK